MAFSLFIPKALVLSCKEDSLGYKSKIPRDSDRFNVINVEYNAVHNEETGAETSKLIFMSRGC